jgi:hypothetical protein
MRAVRKKMTMSGPGGPERRETGKEQEVRVLYDEDLARHIGPESCGEAREGSTEALTGERAGRPLSRDSQLQRSADGVGPYGRQHGRVRYRECPRRLRVVVDPGMHGSSLFGNREISRLTAALSWRPASGRPEGQSR